MNENGDWVLFNPTGKISQKSLQKSLKLKAQSLKLKACSEELSRASLKVTSLGQIMRKILVADSLVRNVQYLFCFLLFAFDFEL
jgi:hypothetical protein